MLLVAPPPPLIGVTPVAMEIPAGLLLAVLDTGVRMPVVQRPAPVPLEEETPPVPTPPSPPVPVYPPKQARH